MFIYTLVFFQQRLAKELAAVTKDKDQKASDLDMANIQKLSLEGEKVTVCEELKEEELFLFPSSKKS